MAVTRGGRADGAEGAGRRTAQHALLRDFGYDNERPDSAIDVVDEDDEKHSEYEAYSGSEDADDNEPATIDVPVAIWVSLRAR